jgi:hypothetical protein
MSYTLAQQLESVQAAIAAIEAGAQQYSIEGRSYTKPDLAALYKREERLLHKIEIADGGDRRVAEF